METYKAFDLVLVPFPFTDRANAKRRPALVLSNGVFQTDSGHLICAMVTSAKRSSWGSDVDLTDWAQAGLPVASTVRMKLFTLDQRIILRPLGQLTSRDAERVAKSVKQALL